MARRGRCAPARSTAKSPTAFAANGAPCSTPISDPSSKPHGEDRSEPSTPSASPSRAAPCLAQLENVNGDLSNYRDICRLHVQDLVHYLTAPTAMPRVSVRWKIRKNRTVGASPSSEAAAVVVGSDVYWLLSVPIATETVWLSLAMSSTSGNRNSFHVQMK